METIKSDFHVNNYQIDHSGYSATIDVYLPLLRGDNRSTEWHKYHSID